MLALLIPGARGNVGKGGRQGPTSVSIRLRGLLILAVLGLKGPSPAAALVSVCSSDPAGSRDFVVEEAGGIYPIAVLALEGRCHKLQLQGKKMTMLTY